MSRQLTEQENQIRERAREIKMQLAAIESKRAVLVAGLKQLQARCTHPDAYDIRRDTKIVKYCPLCGWES